MGINMKLEMSHYMIAMIIFAIAMCLRMDQQSQRTDVLYQMFIDLLKEKK